MFRANKDTKNRGFAPIVSHETMYYLGFQKKLKTKVLLWGANFTIVKLGVSIGKTLILQKYNKKYF